jgi:hypothetical protein
MLNFWIGLAVIGALGILLEALDAHIQLPTPRERWVHGRWHQRRYKR